MAGRLAIRFFRRAAGQERVRIVLQQHAGDSTCSHRPQQMRDLEGSVGVADAVRADVGDAIAVGIGGVRDPAARSGRRPCCRARRGPAARRSASTTLSARSAAATASPTATRPWRTTTSGAMRQPPCRSGEQALQHRSGVQLHRACREAVGDDEAGQVVMRRHVAPALHRAVRCQPAAEIGPHQVVLPVGSGARDREHRQAQTRRDRPSAGFVERLDARRRGRGHGRAGNRAAARSRAKRRCVAGRCARRSDGAGRPRSRRRIPVSGRIVAHAVVAGSSARKRARQCRAAGCGSAWSIRPCRDSQASNSGAGRRPNRSRIASASWNDVL